MKTKLRTAVTSFLLSIAGAVTLSGPALAEADYPTRAITLYVGYKAGGATDTVGRVVAKTLSRELGQPVNVVNRPGAGASMSVKQVSAMKPDGYSLVFNPSDAFTWNPLLNKSLNFTPDDFEYAGTITAYQYGMASPVDRPFNTMREFVDYARENPGLKFATLGPAANMVMEYIEKTEGIELSYVPVVGGSGMINMVMSGQADIALSGGIHVRFPDKVKLIGALTSDRHASNPGVPTFKEQGIPIATDVVTVLAAPKGTSPEIMEKLSKALFAATTDPDVLKMSETMSFPISYRNAADASAEMQAQWKLFKAMTETIGKTNN
ncbi:tripartite tricarboxylate transporter substrate binding protein [Rhodobacteraceae bacterium D3-12]|nr:tripartite tricarboxylate transporter substrate binding protein [Rhodobacteraceae bacterium D3-12]